MSTSTHSLELRWTGVSAQQLVALLLAAVVGLHLLPIWAFTYIPTLDGPNHLYLIETLRHYGDPDAAVLRRYFELNLAPLPNIFTYVLLYGLVHVVPALVAEKILLSAYVAGLPLAAFYAARPLARDPVLAAFFILPLSLGFTFTVGLHNFSFGIVFVLVGIGSYLRADADPSLRRLLALGILGALTYFCHLFAAAMLLLIVAMAGLWRMVRAARGAGFVGRLWPAARRHAVPHALALLPTCLLVISFLLRNMDAAAPALPSPDLLSRAIMLLQPFFLFVFSQRDLMLATILSAILLLTVRAAYRSRGTGRLDADGTFLFVFAACAVIFLLAPRQMLDARIILDRFLPYLFLLLVLWVSGLRLAGHHRTWILGLLTVFLISTAGYRFAQYAEWNGYLEEYVEAAQGIEEHSTILSLRTGWSPEGNSIEPGMRLDPTLHAAAHVAREQEGVFLSLIQAHSEWFPLQYRDAVNPYRHIALGNMDNLERFPPKIDILTYEERTGGRIDYVIVWGPPAGDMDHAGFQSLVNQLRAGYDLIGTSSPRSLMRLYRRKDFLAAPATGPALPLRLVQEEMPTW